MPETRREPLAEPLTLWRLARWEHAASALSGEGARRFAGRWNLPGPPVVYLSAHPALAVMEVFVHLQPFERHVRFVLIAVDVPTGIDVERPVLLPADWREPGPSAGDPPRASQRFGAGWAARGESLLLEVPSVLIPHGLNYLLNPLHRDLGRVHVHDPEPFGFDGRMWPAH